MPVAYLFGEKIETKSQSENKKRAKQE